ncbi:hypothetical protein [Plantactinospora sp. GCM10030261]|uniref:hypothetical protein n=1 Tax=Plantactinospora sp. GCM10030261 TaxID=3273420 RepID=UPI003617963A
MTTSDPGRDTPPPSPDGTGERPETPADGSARRWLPDAAAVFTFLLAAGWVTAQLWRHPERRVAVNQKDQALFEWMMAHGARVVTRFTDPLYTDQMNVPDGVNLMANTSVLAVSIPLTPVTLLFGPAVALLTFLTLGLAGTATAWYFLLSRVLVRSRFAAWTGAAFAGFAPGMVSHANGHPNIVSQFLVPLLVWRTLRLAGPGPAWRNGLLLALVAVGQAFINPEVLVVTAVGTGIVMATLAVLRPTARARMPRFLAGLGVAVLGVAIVLGWPLVFALTGPGSYAGLPRSVGHYGADAASFAAYARESLAVGVARAAGLTLPGGVGRLAPNATEENSFFGLPLLLLLPALVWWLRRRAEVLGLAVAGLVFALFSLGPQVVVAGRETGIRLPWAYLERLPVLEAVLPTRWALAMAPLIAVLLAYGGDRVADLARARPERRRGIRLAAAAVLAVALVPLLPTPLPAVAPEPVPEFVRAGMWREYVDGNRSVVPLPLPDSGYPEPIRWSAGTGLDLRLPRGYFLGPSAGTDRTARFTAPSRPTSDLFFHVRRTGKVPPITAANRSDALDDLRFWQAGVVILAPHWRAEPMRQTMTELIGREPVWRGGVWVWDVRSLLY